MIIATAGHVDHGKTALLQALTGVDADRLPEEKRRGMTIDLGYAYWPQPDGRVVGFIDVPGHEKFLANMLAGIGGIHHALLVVACDDGVMPQTREHLQLLSLAGQPPLSVALTKADRVDAVRIAEVQHQVAQLTQQLGWLAVPQFVTSSTTQQGIDALRQHLSELHAPDVDMGRRFRLAIDRAFTLKGSGLVVTGTALSGEVSVGDTLWLRHLSRRKLCAIVELGPLFGTHFCKASQLRLSPPSQFATCTTSTGLPNQFCVSFALHIFFSLGKWLSNSWLCSIAQKQHKRYGYALFLFTDLASQ